MMDAACAHDMAHQMQASLLFAVSDAFTKVWKALTPNWDLSINEFKPEGRQSAGELRAMLSLTWMRSLKLHNNAHSDDLVTSDPQPVRLGGAKTS